MAGEGHLPRSVDVSETWKKTDGLKKIDKNENKSGLQAVTLHLRWG